MYSKNILGIRIDGLSLEEAQQKVREFLGSSKDVIPAIRQLAEGIQQYKIFTPNPEMAVKAQKDEYFKKVLNLGDLNLCDGKGLEFATGFKRIPGIDFMLEICKVAEEQGSGVYLLGSGSDEVVKKTAGNLKIKFPNLKICGYDKGPEITECVDCHSERSEVHRYSEVGESLLFREGSFTSVQDNIAGKINTSKAQILFVAFGMGKQEKWIYENLSKMPSVKIAMGVGGAFDYISGKVQRAPLFLRKIGLEWLYRLFKQPKRFGRILNATVRFIYLVLSE